MILLFLVYHKPSVYFSGLSVLFELEKLYTLRPYLMLVLKSDPFWTVLNVSRRLRFIYLLQLMFCLG